MTALLTILFGISCVSVAAMTAVVGYSSPWTTSPGAPAMVGSYTNLRFAAACTGLGVTVAATWLQAYLLVTI